MNREERRKAARNARKLMKDSPGGVPSVRQMTHEVTTFYNLRSAGWSDSKITEAFRARDKAVRDGRV